MISREPPPPDINSNLGYYPRCSKVVLDFKYNPPVATFKECGCDVVLTVSMSDNHGRFIGGSAPKQDICDPGAQMNPHEKRNGVQATEILEDSPSSPAVG